MELGKIATYIAQGFVVALVSVAVGFLAGYITQPWGSVIAMIAGIAIAVAAAHFASKSAGTWKFMLDSLAVAGAALTWFAVFALINYALSPK